MRSLGNSEYYQKTIKALSSGDFISVHAMLKDLEEESIWFDEEHAKIEINKARRDYE